MSSIVLVGLNHHTAPVELREQLSLSGCGLTMALEELAQNSRIRESIILSTCNRLEVYGLTSEPAEGWQAIEDFLMHLQGIPLTELKPHLYYLQDETTIKHLMRVACGLDSMILGEPQILGQVSQAYRDAHGVGTVETMFSKLFMQAIHTGKRARTETGISRHTTSVSHAAALLAKDQVGNLETARVLVVGAGEMAEQAIQALQAHHVQSITFINRTYSRANDLAQRFGGTAYNWTHLIDALAEADVVLSATGAPHMVIHTSEVEEAIRQRDSRPLLLIDIAVPRDIEEGVGDLPNVTLHDIDDLQHTLDENLAQRQAAVVEVEQIIQEEIDGFYEWLSGRQVVPIIVGLRRKAEAIAQTELEQALRRLDGMDSQGQDVVKRMAHRIVNKMLYEPTNQLKIQAANGKGYDYADIVRDLFCLDAVGSSGD